MKAIIDNKLYDTETAERILEFPKHSTNKTNSTDHPYGIYETKKGAYFMYEKSAFATGGHIEILSKDIVMDQIRTRDPDKYMELFGAVEEG